MTRDVNLHTNHDPNRIARWRRASEHIDLVKLLWLKCPEPWQEPPSHSAVERVALARARAQGCRQAKRAAWGTKRLELGQSAPERLVSWAGCQEGATASGVLRSRPALGWSLADEVRAGAERVSGVVRVTRGRAGCWRVVCVRAEFPGSPPRGPQDMTWAGTSFACIHHPARGCGAGVQPLPTGMGREWPPQKGTPRSHPTWEPGPGTQAPTPAGTEPFRKHQLPVSGSGLETGLDLL